MKARIWLTYLFLALVPLLMQCVYKTHFQTITYPDWRGPYLGQTPPGMTPELFAPELLSAGGSEANITFSLDGLEMFYTLWTSAGDNLAKPVWPFGQAVIMNSRIENGRWTEPQEFEYTLHRQAVYPFLTADGRYLMYVSWETGEIRLMQSGRVDGKWQKPTPFEGPSGSNTSFAANGNYYFNMESELYMARYAQGQYTTPEKLSVVHQNIGGAHHLYVSPDESYLIFDYDQSKNTMGEEDLYIAFRDKKGRWLPAVNMGSEINTPYRDKRAFVSHDGKYLFFASNRIPQSEPPNRPLTLNEYRTLTRGAENGYEHIYWVDAGVIDKIKTQTR